jgi:hypothetical protein
VDNGRGRRALVCQPAQITMLAALWGRAAARGWDGRVALPLTRSPRRGVCGNEHVEPTRTKIRQGAVSLAWLGLREWPRVDAGDFLVANGLALPGCRVV